MTNTPKTKTEISDAEAEKYAENQFNYWKQQTIKTQNPTLHPSSNVDAFKAGFDCRDKLDNEALRVAVEALEIANIELLTVDDHAAYGKMERYYGEERSHQLNKAVYKIQQALDKIRELRGDQ